MRLFVAILCLLSSYSWAQDFYILEFVTGKKQIPTTVLVDVSINHADCSENSLGSILLDINFQNSGKKTIEYYWKDESGQVISRDEDLLNKLPGTYEISIYVYKGQSSNLQYSGSAKLTILRKVEWVYNITVDVNYGTETLTKDVPGPDWDAGAFSTNLLPASHEGFVEFETDNTTQFPLRLGFSGTANSDPATDLIEYGLLLSYFSGFQQFYVTRIIKGSPPLFIYQSSPSKVHKLRIAKVAVPGGGFEFQFFVDDMSTSLPSVVFSSPVDLIVHARMGAQGAAILRARTTFSCPPPELEELELSEAVLKKKVDASYYIAKDDKIRFRLDEEYHKPSNHQVITHINFFNTQNVLQTGITSTEMNPAIVSYGYNEYEVNLSPLASGRYIMEVINDKNEKWYLKFIY